MSSFENNWRRKQEIRLRPVADRVYRHTLDKEFAIDVKLTLDNGQVLTGQEKFLSHRYKNFASVTVEYEQDQDTGEEGDWYRLAVGFYFVGYATEDELDFEPWVLLNWASTVMSTSKGNINWSYNYNQDGSARASFVHYPMRSFPDECVIACSWSDEPEQMIMDW
jgi:hypothetical protein